MKVLFGSSHSFPQHTRLYLALLASALLLIFDSFTSVSTQVRSHLNSIASPIFYIANAPRDIALWMSENLATRARLIEENNVLKQTLRQQSGRLQQFEFLESENKKLRALLGSEVRKSAKKLIAEVMAVDSQRHRHMIIINLGERDGVREGQAVIDESGVVGQIMSVGGTTSRVLLFSDASHSVPVRIERNDVRAIVEGTGALNSMNLLYVTHNADVVVGDRLVTSGLGGRFPEGYPVAEVTSVDFDRSATFARVRLKPIAHLDRVRYVLVLTDSSVEETADGE